MFRWGGGHGGAETGVGGARKRDASSNQWAVRSQWEGGATRSPSYGAVNRAAAASELPVRRRHRWTEDSPRAMGPLSAVIPRFLAAQTARFVFGDTLKDPRASKPEADKQPWSGRLKRVRPRPPGRTRARFQARAPRKSELRKPRSLGPASFLSAG